MASPFHVFRKYQKTLLVVAGVILMFVFVIGDSLVPYLSSSGDASEGRLSPTAVAVHWDGGQLSNRELDMLVMRRRMVNALIRGVEYAGREASVQAGIEPRPLRVEMLLGAEMAQQGVEQDVVRTKLFADAARKVGMTVSDQNIVHYLDELGRNHVSRDEMRAMLTRQAGGRGASIDFIFDAIREELLARNYLASYQFALETITPEEKWQDWLRVNDRVVVEAAAIPVESFVGDVPQPTEEELVAFFNEFKNREPQPDFLGSMELPSRYPGFAIPRKVDVKYLTANYEKLLEKAEAEITNEEIEKYYESNKDPQFIKTDTSLFDQGGQQPEAAVEETATPPATEPAATPPAAEPAAAETPGTTTVEPAESGDEVAPSEEEAAAEAGGEPSAEAGTTEPSDTPAGSATEAPADQPREEAPATEDSSANPPSGHRGVFHLTALLQNTEEAAEATAETVSEAAAAAGDATPAASEPAAVSGESTGFAPADTPADTAESIPSTEADPAAKTSEAGESETSTASAPTASPDKPVEFQPIDEVRDVIRRRIAEDKITNQSVEQMNQLKGQLYGEFTAYFGSVLDAEAQGKERPAPPAALDDLTALAATHGLELGQTGPMSLLELRDTPIGKSVDMDSGESLLRSLYGKELELYQPTVTYDLDGNRYLVMKVADLPSKVPTLEEVRDQAVRAWKLRKAAELAKKHAEDLARQAKDSGKTLSDFFADDESVKVVRTDPFSWLTGGAVSRTTGQPQPFRLSEPDGVAAAGPDFMQAVFELGPSDVGAELSHDHSVAYVVRIAEHQSAPEELHQDYLSEANTWDGLPTMARSHAQTVARVIQSQMMTDAGVEWDRPADQLTENQEEE